jgi:hypothetical protein
VSKAALLGILLGALSPVFSQTPAASTAQPQPTAAKVAPINQRRVDPAAMYHRVYAVVPMVGTGKKGDPFRPMFVTLPSQATAASVAAHTGILSYQMHVSDDGKFALVEFVGATRADLQPILASTAAGTTVFERGSATQAQIETEFKKYKKDFTMSLFSTRAQ